MGDTRTPVGLNSPPLTDMEYSVISDPFFADGVNGIVNPVAVDTIVPILGADGTP